MKQTKSGFLKRTLASVDEKSRVLLEKSRLTQPIYEHFILSLEASLYQAGDYKLIPAFKKDLKETILRFRPDLKQQSTKYLKQLEKDIVKAHLCNHVSTEEYFLYDFENQDYWQRQEWLSDKDRLDILLKHYGGSVFDELTDKSCFYKLAKDYFNRSVCPVNNHTTEDIFLSFTASHPRFIVKPIDGTMGVNTYIQEVRDQKEAREVYRRLRKEGNWIAEELIVQHKEMAAWNESSVNTVRIPSFRKENGIEIFHPIFRAGRKGSVVDNTGSGGVFAAFDAKTGIITTDGVDEYGRRFECHPDSAKRFKDWQIPLWGDLKRIVCEVHHALPSHHHYVGFDFALTKEGKWVLIEGNWGQMYVQVAERKGVRQSFIKHLK